MSFLRVLLYSLCTTITFSFFAEARVEQLKSFDHKFHEENAFKRNKTSCTDCHNLKESKTGGAASEFIPAEELASMTFKKTLKEICHSCHSGGQVKEAPKACYTCHSNPDQLQTIKPQSHIAGSWKNQHALAARADGDQCLNCHSNSQCIKCHASSNTIVKSNHSRNFRYFHSIEARLKPQSCDSCHTKSDCAKCHVGGKL